MTYSPKARAAPSVKESTLPNGIKLVSSEVADAPVRLDCSFRVVMPFFIFLVQRAQKIR